jgi:vancomycin resistance protein VanJ
VAVQPFTAEHATIATVEKPRPHWLRRLIAAPVVGYVLAVAAWVIAHELTGDDFWLLALANALAVYLFAPLPIMALLALLARRRTAWVSLATAALLFVGLFWGELTPPVPTVRAGDDTPSLTVMTYNVLFAVRDTAPIAASIARAEPDLVAFQELTYLRAQALEQEIGKQYPYRTPIDPQLCFSTVAIWSRHPILRVEAVDPDVACRLKSVVVDFNGRSVRVIDVHAWPYTDSDRESIERGFRWRQEQIELVFSMVEGQPEPLLLLGDFNSAPMSDLYQTVTDRYTDAFTEAGWGLGHTWPAEGGHWYDVPYPNRFVRIDYVFHSSEWRAEDAYVAEWDGASDHHPVVARLRLSDSAK